MEEQNTKPKRNRAQRSAAKRLRDSRVVEMASSGVPIKEIAGEMNIDRTTVTRILSSNEIKAIVNTANSRVHSLVDKALKTVEDAMDNSRLDMPSGTKVAIALLKSVGVLKDKVDLSHSFPKPTIIEKRNGDQVILGAAYDDDETAA